jgi:hypothetical protein
MSQLGSSGFRKVFTGQTQTAMRVTFTKTGERRYGVTVRRELKHDVAINPAPGYHDYLPHDLLHFVAEAEWKLDGAVFGQLAAGGDAGIFIPVDHALIPRAMRDRKRARRREGRPRGRRSEVLTDLLETAWTARQRSAPPARSWDDRLAAARVTHERLTRVLDQLDEMADEWHGLRVGESITLDWPRRERHGRPRRR